MRKYLQKYKKAIIIYFVFGVIIIPLFIHILFKIDAPLPFLVAEWEAGDVLAFYGVLIGALATIAGVYLSNVAAQENYRKDVVNRSLPFMTVTARKVKTVDLDNDGDAPDVNLKNNDTYAAFEEYDVERLYFVIEKGVVRICEFLTDEQMQFVQTGGHGRDELFPGGYSYYSVRSIYTPLEIENVGNGAATVFSVGINNTKLSKIERIFSIARTLKVGQKFYIAIYSENIDKSNCGEYDMCISYYDILGNGYEQNYTLKIWEDEKKAITSCLMMNGTQQPVEKN